MNTITHHTIRNYRGRTLEVTEHPSISGGRPFLKLQTKEAQWLLSVSEAAALAAEVNAYLSRWNYRAEPEAA